MVVFVNTLYMQTFAHRDGIAILDCTMNRNTSESAILMARKINNARLIDFKDFSDPNGKFPNTFPTKKQFETTVRNLGIQQTDAVVVYDERGLYGAARIWFIFKQYGHENCYILDGGMAKYRDEKGDIELRDIPMKYEKTDYVAKDTPKNLVTLKQVKKALKDPNIAVIDARAESRFIGSTPEPRKEIPSGHMPGSHNIPFDAVINYADGGIVDHSRFTELFEPFEGKELWFSCGSGVTACIPYAIATSLGLKKLKIYDGSWTEWASSGQDIAIKDDFTP